MKGMSHFTITGCFMAKCNTLIECIKQTKVNLPEFQRDCIKIVDFLLITNFGTSLIFFGTLSIL